ncbi:MAG: carbamoyltransferase C-terminal domain-containing protein [Polyangiaceae bacterium]
MIVLGINAFHGDASAAILVDGELRAAVEEERFERVKHWAGFPKRSVEYCLSAVGARIEDVDHVSIGRDTRAHLLDKVLYVMKKRPSTGFLRDRARNMMKVKSPGLALAASLGVDPERLTAREHAVEHHRSHQASAYFASPFDESAIVSVDGFGDFVGAMWAVGRGNKMRVLKRVAFPHSLGLFYSAMTQYLGFPRFGDEYKVMGMSAFGEPEEAWMQKLRQVVRLTPDGGFELGLEYFEHHTRGIAMTWVGEPRYDRIFSDRLIELLGPPREAGQPVEARHLALAACVQRRYEEAYFHILAAASRLTGSRNLCVAGGCGQNSLANGKVLLRGQFDELFIQPASYDAGTALGAALYTHHHDLDNPRRWRMQHAFWGPGYTQSQVEQVLREEGADYRVVSDHELCATVARRIAEGAIVGWFQGRMEWGPRALGHRSILANPCRADMKDILNARIKKRESFRPFAPAILAEAVPDYFEQSAPDPFMTKVYKIRPEKRALIPSVTHVDGTGRLQTVTRQENPTYYGVIKAFGAITGVPVLINTSFNENEPIVCSPKQALDCFRRTPMDLLVMENCLVERQGGGAA